MLEPTGSLDENAFFERGVVTEVYPGRGVVDAKTVSGRVVENVRPVSSGGGPAGTGAASLPSAGSLCLLISFTQNLNQSFLIGSFAPREAGQRSARGHTQRLMQGEQAYFMENGGHVRYGPDGLVDVKSHPWARSTWIPTEHQLKEHIRKWERVSHPLGLVRSINDLKEERSFYEEFVNDKFIFREGDPYPAIIRTLGDNTGRLTSPGNPQSPWLSFRQIEKRPPSKFDPLYRWTEEIGGQEGVVRREKALDLKSESGMRRRAGNFEHGLAETVLWHDGQEVYYAQRTASGLWKTVNPSYYHEVDPEGAARLSHRQAKSEWRIDDTLALLKGAVRAEVSNQVSGLIMQGAFGQLHNGSVALTLAGPQAGLSAPLAAPSVLFGSTGPPPLQNTVHEPPEHSESAFPNTDVEVKEESATGTHFGDTAQGQESSSDPAGLPGESPSSSSSGDEESGSEEGEQEEPEWSPEVDTSKEARGGNSKASVVFQENRAALESRHPSVDIDGVEGSDPGSYAWVKAEGEEAEVGNSSGARATAKANGDLELNGSDHPAVLGNELTGLLNQMLAVMESMAGKLYPPGSGAPDVTQIQTIKAKVNQIKSQSVKLS